MDSRDPCVGTPGCNFRNSDEHAGSTSKYEVHCPCLAAFANAPDPPYHREYRNFACVGSDESTCIVDPSWIFVIRSAVTWETLKPAELLPAGLVLTDGITLSLFLVTRNGNVVFRR